MLQFIWIVSLLLCGIAFAVTFVLAALRYLDDRRQSGDTIARKRLFTALIRFTEDDDKPALQRVLAETPPRVIANAGFEFTGLLRGEDEARVEQAFGDADLGVYVRRRLRRGDEAERIYCTEMLTAFPGRQTVRSLTTALDDPSREVRIASALALVRLGVAPSIGTLLDRIGVQGQRSRRLVDLFRALGETGTEEIRTFISNGVGAPFLRAAAIEALSTVSDYRLIALFEDLASDPSSEVAAASIRALGRHGRPESAGAVIRGLRRADWQVRSEAAEAVGRLGLSQAIDELAELLGDEEWVVRYAAGKALRNFGAEGRRVLEHAAVSQSSRGQRTASMILAEDQAA
ncbi:HEAT repeat domain-containing protein [Parvibaculum sp.]|uniref:HEAT repeat domain-containing protein n=1 Tax=Parvibaculum sp. TaxID=2024848 RepID=UPI001B08D489|nr:HEAT repeat domain-containing protein [Parvibaculum sp.]MBO6633895.1 HEAT repeat domain-containing protein [Parvibaculum sp.]MBO6677905.1 HEAT repeat domain-containing protein [Parvibaculum sp.]MBO6683379.1 HEAT repeat domain-containing protein [Parvibaculum sp.]MBO6904603.1 HEAT repeat domain-containing protein [Parvibaculum sp.]